MREEFLHYLFQTKQLGNEFYTTSGQKIRIQNFGNSNKNAGPDFEACRIEIDGQVWAGSIEFHLRSSDWFLHRHHVDPRYENVILHMVGYHDRDVVLKGEKIPTVELKDLSIFSNNQLDFTKTKNNIPCSKSMNSQMQREISSQYEILAGQRLFRKSGIILADLYRSGDLQRALYDSLALTLGGKVNAQPMLALFNLLDLRQVGRFVDPDLSVPALLFGLSGLLPPHSTNENLYITKLRDEFDYLGKKHNLVALNPVIWKFSRMHPGGFPTLRIAEFSELVKKLYGPLEILENANNPKFLKSLFLVPLPVFWKDHVVFPENSSKGVSGISLALADQILINTIAPFLLACSIYLDDAAYKQNAIELLRQTLPESNSVQRQWTKLGLVAKSALETQALIELKNEYCSKKKCLFCKAGIHLLRA